MLAVNIEVTTAKGKTQTTLWGIDQTRPYPDIHKDGSRLAWRNAPELFGQYGNPPTGLAARYRAELLRSDWTPETADGTRLDCAGYNDRLGVITFRNKSLGEVSATVDLRPHGCGGARFRVRGFEPPTPSERAFLDDQVTPALTAFIQGHAAELWAEAIAALRDRVALALSDARDALDGLERDAADAISAL